jgi:PIN domain nuclease of toxin-antitoxin system
MKLLLDTHAFLWFIDDSPALSVRGKTLLEAENELFLSVASLWEIAIKLRLGKLSIAIPTEALMTEHVTANNIELLPISVPHLIEVSTLALHHRDPFDRLIVAQASVEQMPVVSADPAFDSYPIERLW